MGESWHAVGLELPRDAVETVASLLHELGSNGAVEEASADPGRVRLVAYFDAGHIRKEELLDRIRAALSPFPPLAGAALDVVTTANEWKEKWRQWFSPFSIVPGIVVAPSWERYRAKAGESVITLDPGMAFGTGLHATTALCAEAIGKMIQPPFTLLSPLRGEGSHSLPSPLRGEGSHSLPSPLRGEGSHSLPSPLRGEGQGEGASSLLDVGTGSGLLAIVARRLGIERIAAVDSDPDALRVAQENFEINGVGGVTTAASIAEIVGPFDIVVANILLLTILELRDELIARTAPGGRLVVSGITHDQEARIAAAFAPPLRLLTTTRREEWSCMVFNHPSPPPVSPREAWRAGSPLP